MAGVAIHKGVDGYDSKCVNKGEDGYDSKGGNKGEDENECNLAGLLKS